MECYEKPISGICYVIGFLSNGLKIPGRKFVGRVQGPRDLLGGTIVLSRQIIEMKVFRFLTNYKLNSHEAVTGVCLAFGAFCFAKRFHRDHF